MDIRSCKDHALHNQCIQCTRKVLEAGRNNWKGVSDFVICCLIMFLLCAPEASVATLGNRNFATDIRAKPMKGVEHTAVKDWRLI